MDFEDFYDLAVYANENWQGHLTQKEIARRAYIYTVEHDACGTESEIIQAMLEQLAMDNSEEAREFERRIRR